MMPVTREGRPDRLLARPPDPSAVFYNLRSLCLTERPEDERTEESKTAWERKLNNVRLEKVAGIFPVGIGTPQRWKARHSYRAPPEYLGGARLRRAALAPGQPVRRHDAPRTCRNRGVRGRDLQEERRSESDRVRWACGLDRYLLATAEVNARTARSLIIGQLMIATQKSTGHFADVTSTRVSIGAATPSGM